MHYNNAQFPECQARLAKLTDLKYASSSFAVRLRPIDPETSLALYLCGTSVTLQADRVVSANFCRNRWCSLCQWRKSELLYHQNRLVWDHLGFEKYRYVFLTVTVRNVPLADLKQRIKDMSEAMHRLQMNRSYKSVGVAGMQRTLEVTYNQQSDTWHPHYHCILVVPVDKWLPDRQWWVHLWQQSVRDPTITQVDIRTVKDRGDPVKEISKYVVKTKDFAEKLDLNRDWFLLRGALQNVRLINSSGVWRDARKLLKLPDVDKADLLDKPTVTYDTPGVVYKWDDLLMQYSVIGVVAKEEIDK